MHFNNGDDAPNMSCGLWVHTVAVVNLVSQNQSINLNVCGKYQ